MKQLLPAALTLLVLAGALIASFQDAGAKRAEPNEPVPQSVRAFGPVHPRISPDGETIVFSWQGAIWSVPRSGGMMRQLTEGSGYDIEPAFSPDGQQVAYLNSPGFSSGRVQIVDVQTGEAVKLPAPAVAVGKLFYHPDGSQLLGNFRLADRSIGLAWLNLQTGRLTPLLSPPQRVQRLSLSGDGTTIAYATTMDVPGQQTGNNGPQADLWQLPAAGGRPDKVTRFPNRIHDTCFVGTQRELLVVTDLGGAHYDLWKVPLDDPDRLARKLTFGQADEDRPSVSNDGRWLAFTDNRRGATELVVRDLFGGGDETAPITGREYLHPTGTLKLSTADDETGEPVTARVVVKSNAGQFHAPVGALYRVSTRGANCFFYCRGECVVELPAGEYTLSVQRGFEHRPVHREIQIEAGQTFETTLAVERWIDQPAQGWYGGENHIHANYGYGHWYSTPETMLDQCEGEGLSVCNFVVANSDTDGVFDREFFRGKPDRLSTDGTILYWNQEFRSTFWGHLTLVNLNQLVEPIFTGFQDTTNPWDAPTNSDIARATHRQNGLANYTHPTRSANDPYVGPYSAKGIPVDVALGNIDTMDINGGYPVATSVWYRLLNCGFRLPASAGTDCFLNRIRSRFPGADRVYVKLEGPLDYDKWVEGLRAGRSFVTNGPMLEFGVNNKPAGSTIELGSPGTIVVRASGGTQFSLTRGEVVFNGNVVATVPADAQGQVSFKQSVKIPGSGWLAFRVIGPAHADHHAGTIYAHTSPVYVSVDRQPTASPEAAAFFLKWIDRLEAEMRQRNRFPSNELRRHALSQIDAARDVYRGVVKRAQTR
ncbi:MAG: hypothetical protein CMJ48_02260 [Planctomycetaceae bacterium]|nr:hypothetical protein [Planctomycetaceae bacterium]